MTSPSGPTGNTYDKYATSNPIEARLMSTFFRALDAMLDSLAPQRILEVGVGEGEVSERLRARFPDASIVGLDLMDDALVGQWRDRRLDCMFGDATNLPFADDTFDLVLAVEVLEHVERFDDALAELDRVVDGHFVASVPFEPIWRLGNVARGRYLRDFGNTPGHVNHWNRWSFGRLVATRFEPLAVRTPMPWTMLLARSA